MKHFAASFLIACVLLTACNNQKKDNPDKQQQAQNKTSITDSKKQLGREVKVGNNTFYIKDSLTFKGKGAFDEDYECFFSITADSVFTTILSTDSTGKVTNYETNSMAIAKLNTELISCQKGSNNDFTLNLIIKDGEEQINYNRYSGEEAPFSNKHSTTHITFNNLAKIKEVAQQLGVKNLPINDK
jgi:hypothetical protein